MQLLPHSSEFVLRACTESVDRQLQVCMRGLDSSPTRQVDFWCCSHGVGLDSWLLKSLPTPMGRDTCTCPVLHSVRIPWPGRRCCRGSRCYGEALISCSVRATNCICMCLTPSRSRTALCRNEKTARRVMWKKTVQELVKHFTYKSLLGALSFCQILTFWLGHIW